MLPRLCLFVCVIISAVHCQPKPCCYPDAWEATEGILSGSVDDEGNTAITMGYIQLSFDVKGKRIHGVETVQTGGTAKKYTFLQLYDQSVQYTIVNTTCTRSKLGPWNNQNCIPSNATVTNQYRLGLNQSIMVSDYSFNIGTVQYVVTVTNDMCVPVVEQTYGDISGVELMLSVGVNDLTAGIKDPHVFDIPSICSGKNVIDVKGTKPSMSFMKQTKKDIY